ncbi:RNA recognition motif domain containing protein [Babesia bovis T2Bo]|uniref:CCR4-NOT transcription complex subunit 4 n=2 Tax=Babesia bovis TaxID=5865 RepID=A7AQF3_BABBO|nr:RNA recognition motif domain containing protein [Babesia bovis T2Bo]EDO06772.1 RNA recognition motif domain containing protein [Babesia bovis T2Bo]|eukprot:XP_001610340.1 hypothetical protein [Babesia bovis T2Bo]
MDGHRTLANGKDADDELLCPLCMEVLDETDRNFFPCTCEYQVCLWCLHYLRTTMGNKCPACRRDYEESNMKYKSAPRTQMNSRTQTSKKHRNASDKDATTRDEEGCSPGQRNNANLKEIRVIQRNLVYVVGIPAKLAKKDILKQQEYFGQYGKIQHIVINKSQSYNSHVGGASYTAYITYSKKTEAATAIQGIDGSYINGKLLRASYGTTKYCTFFLKGLKCTNVDCFYLHRYGDESERISKEELTNLMHKAVKSGVGLGSHALDTTRIPKIHADAHRRAVDDDDLEELTKDNHSDHLDDDNIDDFTEHHLSLSADRDPTSWINVSAAFKTDNDAAEHGEESLYKHTDELQYSLGATDGSDSYSHVFDAYGSDRDPTDFHTNTSFLNSYFTQVDLDSIGKLSSMDQHELMKSLFNNSLMKEIERFNRGEHVIYAEEVCLKKDESSSWISIKEKDERGEDDGVQENDLYGLRWIPAGDALSTGAHYVSNRRRQVDTYKNLNQLMNDEAVVMPIPTATVSQKDIFPDDSQVDSILTQVKRHVSMLDCLIRMYHVDGSTLYADSQLGSVTQDNVESFSEGDASPYNNSITSKMIIDSAGEPYQEMVADMYVDTILDTSLSPESQLETDLKLHYQMSEHVRKLIDQQQRCDMVFVKHLSELYAS